MRKIKFRYIFRHKKDKNRFYSMYYDIEDLERNCVDVHENDDSEWELVTRDESIDKFDENGIEIYENDILKAQIGHFGEYVCKIVWNNCGFFFEPMWGFTLQRFVIWENIAHCEIIGNLVENYAMIEERNEENR